LPQLQDLAWPHRDVRLGGGIRAQAYELDLGNSVGAFDILRQNAGLDTSLTVKSLPTDCRTVYVRLNGILPPDGLCARSRIDLFYRRGCRDRKGGIMVN